MIYVVLGMGRSGTTVVAETLHHSGVDMVECPHTSNGYDEGGTWERAATKSVNHELLRSRGVPTLRIPRCPSAPPTQEQSARMQHIAEDLSRRHADWGFKDPRTCMTYGWWSRELPEHRLIAVYRPLEECFAHYVAAARGRWWRYISVLVRCVPQWCYRNTVIADAVERNPDRALLLSYPRLMDGVEELRRLERFIDRTVTDRRRQDLYRHRACGSIGFRIACAIHRFRGGAQPCEVERRLESLRLIAIGKPSDAG